MLESPDEPKILTESEVMELKKKHGVVLFYMNGCGHCVTMKPAWNKLINELKEKHKHEIILGAVESGGMDIFNKHDLKPSVSGFPTILYFNPKNPDKPESYSGDRSYEDMKKWILKKKGGSPGNNLVILSDNEPKNKSPNKSPIKGASMVGGGRRLRKRTRRRTRRRHMIHKSHKHRKSTARRNTKRRYHR
jgi:hypothetical protein